MGTPAASHKKKGMASALKKAPRRPKNGAPSTKAKKTRSGPTAWGSGEPSSDEESDSGPYCICRGPDNHRWMICCETCEDWFHGECINITKDVGESLIEKFICPKCTAGNRVTIYKKTCALGGCRNPARLRQAEPSVFCSGEHVQTWWERVVARLPKVQPKDGPGEPLSQDELMALLGGGLGGVGEDGTWKVVKTPFSGALPGGAGDEADDGLSCVLSEEERAFLENADKARVRLAEETRLCHKMLALAELAQECRRAATAAGRFGEDVCGYDARLDTISARDAFAAYVESAEGAATLGESKLGDPLDEGDEVRGMCERKRCKVHSGWQKMLPLGIKYQIREMANNAAALGEEEAVVRDAAGERWKRKQAESNWVEAVE